MKTSVNLYRRSQEEEFSKDMDMQGEKELEMDTSVSLEGSSEDVITKRSGCMFHSERCCPHKDIFQYTLS